MDVFTLAAKLTLDSSSFASGLQDAESKGNGLNGVLTKVTSAAKKVATALALKKGVETMKSLAEAAASAGDKIDKQSQALGMSRQAYQEWDYILSQSGSSIDSLGVSMKTLNNSILSGNDSVEKLGLSFDDLSNMNMEQQFETVVKAFQEMPEGAEKSALAVELFGRNGMELLPLLNSSSDTIDTLRQRFEDLGIAMSDDMIDSAVNYTDAMDTMQRTLQAAGIAIGAELLPNLTEWITKATNFAGELLSAYKDNGIEGIFDTLNQKLSKLIENLKTSDSPFLQFLGSTLETIQTALITVKNLFTDFQGTVASMKESDSAAVRAIGTALETIKSVFDWVVTHQTEVITAVGAILAAFAVEKITSFVTSLSPVTLILAGIAALATVIITNWSSIQKFFEDLWAAVKTAVSDAWAEFSKWIGDISSSVAAAWGTVADWFNTNVWEPIKKFFTSAWDTISKLWTGITGFIVGAWFNVSSWFDTNVISPIKKFFEDLFGTMSKIWTDISSSISDAWGAVYSVLAPIIEPIKTLFQGVVDTVKSIWNVLSDIFNLGDKTINITTVHKKVVKTTYEDGMTTTEYDDGSQTFEDDEGGGGASHPFAKGEWNVPYDDYPALLHRGERVLTASQARQMDDGVSGTTFDGLVSAVVQAIREGMQGVQVNSYLDGRELTDAVNRYQGEDLTAGRFA